MTRDEINISRIQVEGIGGLGLVAMAGVVAYFLPELRWLTVIILVGGVTLGLTLLAIRHSRARRTAVILIAVLFAFVLAIAKLKVG